MDNILEWLQLQHAAELGAAASRSVEHQTYIAQDPTVDVAVAEREESL